MKGIKVIKYVILLTIHLNYNFSFRDIKSLDIYHKSQLHRTQRRKNRDFKDDERIRSNSICQTRAKSEG